MINNVDLSIFFIYPTRLKKEMVMRVNQVAAEFRKVSNKQMAETTKRTIRENVSINAQLGKMSDKTMELIQVSVLQQGVFVVFAINGM